MTTDRDFVAEALREVVADIGQVDHASKLALGRAVRAGILSKWRGRWFPHAGAPFGLGPLKTCYGPNEIAAYYAAWRGSLADDAALPPSHGGDIS